MTMIKTIFSIPLSADIKLFYHCNDEYVLNRFIYLDPNNYISFYDISTGPFCLYYDY